MVGRGRGGRRGGRGGRSQRGNLNNDAYSEPRQYNGSSRLHFSLSEEARYTECHHSWNSDLKLRHSRVAFVSAGSSSAEELTRGPQGKCKEHGDIQAKKNETASVEKGDVQANKKGTAKGVENPTTIITPEGPMSKMSLSDGPSTGALEFSANQTFEASIPVMSKQGQLERGDSNTGTSNNIFFTELKGSAPPIHTGFLPPTIKRSPSPAASDTSDEIIVFAGRKSSQVEPRKAISYRTSSCGIMEQQEIGQSHSIESLHQTMATILNDPIKAFLGDFTSAQQQTSSDHETPKISTASGQRTQDLSNGDLAKATKNQRRGRRRNRQRQADEDARILADYIANTNDSDDLDGSTRGFKPNQHDLDVSDNAEREDEAANAISEHKGNKTLNDFDEWDSADLRDFGEISTSSETLDSIEQILLKRVRPSGVQFLVVGGGQEVDDARWLPLDALDVPGANEKIRIFEEEQAKFKRLMEESDDPEESLNLDEQLALDAQQDMFDLEDGKYFEEGWKVRMTDEQIARLLTTQEELGLESGDLKLFDGCESDAGDEVEAQFDGIWEGVPKTQRQTKSRRKQVVHPNFPSATALADVLEQDPYNGFDVMDRDRPSLRKRPKGRRGQLPMELSDLELELQLQTAWENDRSKKKECKQEREELRAQGLLGKEGKHNLKVRYTEGMSMVEVKIEIKEFLLSARESLSLPPMAQRERKMVHEIANVFKLKSKSIGSGTSRFPILYRTSETTQYDEDALGAIEDLLSSRRFLPRMDKGKKKGTPSGKARGAGFAGAGVSYRDGEVVGATAPELGQGNKGRAMLEKMGWSTGTTLGALNNDRGIVQPVAQVVKTGKAGLG